MTKRHQNRFGLTRRYKKDIFGYVKTRGFWKTWSRRFRTFKVRTKRMKIATFLLNFLTEKLNKRLAFIEALKGGELQRYLRSRKVFHYRVDVVKLRRKRKRRTLHTRRLLARHLVTRFAGFISIHKLRSYIRKASFCNNIFKKFMAFIETRFDTILYRLHFITWPATGRQWINHGKYTLNGKINFYPSTLVKLYDVISVKNRGRFFFSFLRLLYMGTKQLKIKTYRTKYKLRKKKKAKKIFGNRYKAFPFQKEKFRKKFKKKLNFFFLGFKWLRKLGLLNLINYNFFKNVVIRLYSLEKRRAKMRARRRKKRRQRKLRRRLLFGRPQNRKIFNYRENWRLVAAKKAFLEKKRLWRKKLSKIVRRVKKKQRERLLVMAKRKKFEFQKNFILRKSFLNFFFSFLKNSGLNVERIKKKKRFKKILKILNIKKLTKYLKLGKQTEIINFKGIFRVKKKKTKNFRKYRYRFFYYRYINNVAATLRGKCSFNKISKFFLHSRMYPKNHWKNLTANRNEKRRKFFKKTRKEFNKKVIGRQLHYTKFRLSQPLHLEINYRIMAAVLIWNPKLTELSYPFKANAVRPITGSRWFF